MKTIILGGFLGSGKTTFLLKLAHFLTEKSQSQKEYKLMIIENEIGSVGVDTTLLNGEGLEVRNLFSGCACCTLTRDLIYMVEKIQKEYEPEHLIIEASGVAIPENIRDTLLQMEDLQVRTIVLADASRWNKLLLGLQMIIPNQLQKADVVLINKADLVDAETFSAVKKSVQGYAQKARVIPASMIKPISQGVMEQIVGGKER